MTSSSWGLCLEHSQLCELAAGLARVGQGRGGRFSSLNLFPVLQWGEQHNEWNKPSICEMIPGLGMELVDLFKNFQDAKESSSLQEGGSAGIF